MEGLVHSMLGVKELLKENSTGIPLRVSGN